MPGKHTRQPLFADYLHFVKDGREYRLSFQTRSGEQKPDRTFTGAQVDTIRARQRTLRKKKLTVSQWLDFISEL